MKEEQDTKQVQTPDDQERIIYRKKRLLDCCLPTLHSPLLLSRCCCCFDSERLCCVSAHIISTASPVLYLTANKFAITLLVTNKKVFSSSSVKQSHTNKQKNR